MQEYSTTRPRQAHRTPCRRILPQVSTALRAKKPKTYARVCSVCGHEFEARRPWASYCSDACQLEGKRRQQWAVKGTTAPTIPAVEACPVCGRPLARAKLRRHAVYCSHACKRAEERRRWAEREGENG